MEGVGSQLGRASRYGPSPTAAVFNGPVRKWKKKWVHVSPSSAASNHHNSHSQPNGHSNNNYSSRLLLCRWTPLSAAAAAAAAADTPLDEPPRRRFRYTPIAVLEEQKKSAKKVEHEASTAGINHQLTPLQSSKNVELNTDSAMKTETQDSITSNLDLDLCLKGYNSENDSLNPSKEDQTKQPSSGRFWTTS